MNRSTPGSCHSPSPGACSNSGPSSRWCHPAISGSVPFSSCPQSFPASGSFQISQLYTSGDQNIGVSASTSVPPMNTQDLVLNVYCFYTDTRINLYHLVLHFLFSSLFSKLLLSSTFPCTGSLASLFCGGSFLMLELHIVSIRLWQGLKIWHAQYLAFINSGKFLGYFLFNISELRSIFSWRFHNHMYVDHFYFSSISQFMPVTSITLSLFKLV